MKLPAESALGFDGARENNQAARFLVEPLHDAQPRQRTASPSALPLSDQLRHDVLERRAKGLAACWPVTLDRVSHGGKSCWLLHDHKVLIEVAEDNCFILPRACGPRKHFHGLVLLQSPGRVEAEFAVEPNATRFDKAANLRPGLTLEVRP